MLRARTHEPSEYEEALGAALEQVFADGITELGAVCEALNARGVKDPDGGAWTEGALAQFLASLP